MKVNWIASTVATLALSGLGIAQSWISAYDAGLKAAKSGKWADARKSFLMARSNRPDDSASATTLPGPVASRKQWRDGAPYSPNFLAAYASFKLGMTTTGKASEEALTTAATEFEALVAKKQAGKETLFALNSIYAKLGQSQKAADLAKTKPSNWKVDVEGMSPDDVASAGTGTRTSGGGIVAAIPAGSLTSPYGNLGSIGPASSAPVAILPKKFALIIGNSESKMPGVKQAHAADDARLLRESLVSSGGYDPAQVEVVVNASSDQIKKVAATLAAKMPEEGTLFLFFSGAGVNIEGRDYMAGIETEIPTDTASMVSKSDLFQPFVAKGTSIFAFFQVDRKMINGRAFGFEEPRVGRVSQMQATMPGETVYSAFRGGKVHGIFADAMASTINELHSNQIPIGEFGWQVFYRLRRGNTGDQGGGSRQVPTLPVLQFLAANARF